MKYKAPSLTFHASVITQAAYDSMATTVSKKYKSKAIPITGHGDL
jgi:hypothetical protein